MSKGAHIFYGLIITLNTIFLSEAVYELKAIREKLNQPEPPPIIQRIPETAKLHSEEIFATATNYLKKVKKVAPKLKTKILVMEPTKDEILGLEDVK